MLSLLGGAGTRTEGGVGVEEAAAGGGADEGADEAPLVAEGATMLAEAEGELVSSAWKRATPADQESSPGLRSCEQLRLRLRSCSCEERTRSEGKKSWLVMVLFLKRRSSRTKQWREATTKGERREEGRGGERRWTRPSRRLEERDEVNTNIDRPIEMVWGQVGI